MLDDFRTEGKLYAPAQVTLDQARLKVTPSAYSQQILGESLPCHLCPVITDLVGSPNSKVTLIFGYFFKEKNKG